jgi:4-diphosphocytidyl-2-C-methyl-D-erythritol kinase
MILKSFSKINFSLKINKKIKNGIHDIESYFCLINLFDKIRIQKVKKKIDIIKFRGKFSKNIDNNKNSISETLKTLRQNKLIKNYYSVVVDKKIPVFAGLGGGTGNAACLIEYFVKRKMNKNLFKILEKKIGSDLKLFFYKQGFLESLKKVKTIKKKYNFFFLLIYPNIRSSTKNAYLKVKKYSLKSKYNFNKINNKKNFINMLIDSNNDFQSILENKYPIIKKLIKEIRQKQGCYFSRMTGSGSVCYGVFESEKTAKVALTRIKSKYPKFWFSVAKTI